MNSTKITIEATIASEIKKVWDYYTLPEHITNWNFASDDWCCPSASNDMQVGGKYSARMEAKDGSFGFDFEAIYESVSPYDNFIYVLADGRKIDVKFNDSDGKTKMVIIFDAENENPVEFQKAGWQAILNNFKAYTETH